MDTPPAVLGEPDPLHVPKGGRLCGARSPVFPFMLGPFLCTRVFGHHATEHVACGAFGSLPPIAVAAWTGHDLASLRVVDVDEGRWPS